MYKLIKPLLFKIEHEKGTWINSRCLKIHSEKRFLLPFVNKLFTYEHPSLSQNIKGITFKNPVGFSCWFWQSCGAPKHPENAGFAKPLNLV